MSPEELLAFFPSVTPGGLCLLVFDISVALEICLRHCLAGSETLSMCCCYLAGVNLEHANDQTINIRLHVSSDSHLVLKVLGAHNYDLLLTVHRYEICCATLTVILVILTLKINKWTSVGTVNMQLNCCITL